jgi:hypothetical protein
LLLVSETAAPATAAVPVSATVAATLLPPVTVGGLSVRLPRPGPDPPPDGFTVSTALRVTPADSAVIEREMGAPTGWVVTVKV